MPYRHKICELHVVLNSGLVTSLQRSNILKSWLFSFCGRSDMGVSCCCLNGWQATILRYRVLRSQNSWRKVREQTQKGMRDNQDFTLTSDPALFCGCVLSNVDSLTEQRSEFWVLWSLKSFVVNKVPQKGGHDEGKLKWSMRKGSGGSGSRR